jgi:hypothetical protein
LATLVTSGRAGLAASVKARNIFLGIGAGQVAWDAAGVDPENIAATTLQDPIGYRKAAQVDFVASAAQGAISLPSGRYDVSTADTNLLYCKFTLDFADASSSTIRETGIFLDVITDGSLPSGQMFFEAASEVTASGTLYLLEHTASIIRTPATRETFEFVLTF